MMIEVIMVDSWKEYVREFFRDIVVIVREFVVKLDVNLF